jgi:RNA polymerase sigma-70 factor (ECF subfamily)
MTVLTDANKPVRSRAEKGNVRDATPREADARLMAALQRQEPAAAEALYGRYASRIYGLGLVLLKDKVDAEDLVQDTLLKVWRTASAFDPRRGRLDVWILLTARSLAIDLLRRRSLEMRKLAFEPSRMGVSDEPGPEWHAERRDLIQRVLEAMDRLPPRQRSAVALAYLGERSSSEVADVEGIPRGTAKSRIQAGIATLRHTFAERRSAPPPAGLCRRSEAIRWSRGERS